MKYKAELNLVRNQNVDITNFEDKINTFKEGFARNYDLASRKFKTAIEEIDKTISHLQKTKMHCCLQRIIFAWRIIRQMI